MSDASQVRDHEITRIPVHDIDGVEIHRSVSISIHSVDLTEDLEKE